MKTRTFTPLLAIALLGLCVGVGAEIESTPAPGASDWPIYRGDAALTGVAATTLPDAPKLLWSFKTEGPILSSPVVGNGRVYVGSSDEKLYALDMKTGAKVWDYAAGAQIEAPPTLHGDAILFGATDGSLRKLDAASGESLWEYEAGDKIIGAPVVASIGERKLVLIGSHDTFLRCVDFKTGEQVWTYATDNYINATPTLLDGGAKVAFGGCDGLVHVVAVEDGSKIAQIEVGDYVASAGAYADGKLYVGHYGNQFVRIDLHAGRIDWSYAEHNFPYSSSPAIGESLVVVGGHGKRLIALKREDGTEVWSFPTLGPVDGSPVIAGDKVLFGSGDGRLRILSLADGKELWSYEIGGGIVGSPAVAARNIVVGSEDGSVYAFGDGNSP